MVEQEQTGGAPSLYSSGRAAPQEPALDAGPGPVIGFDDPVGFVPYGWPRQHRGRQRGGAQRCGHRALGPAQAAGRRFFVIIQKVALARQQVR